LPSTRSTIPAIPALDGLRGLAVLGILLFHAGHLEGGWLGVDVFFVLSGFLISSLLLAEFETRRDISLVAFWARRARRLLPALFALLLGACGFALFFAEPDDLARIRGDALSTLAYVANWHAILAGHDYWDIFRNPSPLDHTWSLAIEEQFYLFWPPLVLLILRRAKGSGPTALARWAIGLALCSAAWMALLYDPDEGTARLYFGSDTRVAATLVGAALAALLRVRVRDWPGGSSRGVDLCAAAALVVLVVAAARLDGSAAIVYRGGLFGLALASAVIVAGIVLAPRGVVSRLLALAPLRALGLVSYGVYLWHWPLYLVLTPERVGLEGVLLSALRIAVSLAVATLSYYALERPIRRGAIAPRRLLVGGCVAAVALAACIVLATSNARSGGETSSLSPGGPGRGAEHTDVLLLGDSVAFELQGAFLRDARARGLSAESLSMSGCSALSATKINFLGGQVFLLSNCLELREVWKRWVARHSPSVVLLVEGWPGEGQKLVDDEWTHPCEEDFDRTYARDLAELIEAFGRSASRTALVTIPMPRIADLSPRHAPLWAGTSHADLEVLFEERVACQNDVRRKVADETGALLLDLRAHMCPDEKCVREIEGRVLRPDGVHFKRSGAVWAADWLLSELALEFDWSPDAGSER
jgi:peptidoglycan/LPS O-acetylase OafA/YrhL